MIARPEKKYASFSSYTVLSHAKAYFRDEGFMKDHLDKEIDSLLRKHASKATMVACQGFDADLAVSYLEKVLKDYQQREYEEHLTLCADCRKMMAEYLIFTQQTLPEPLMTTPVDLESERLPVAVAPSPISWLTKLTRLLSVPSYRLAFTLAVTIFLSVGLAYLYHNSGNSQSAQQKQPKLPVNINGSTSVTTPTQTTNDKDKQPLISSQTDDQTKDKKGNKLQTNENSSLEANKKNLPNTNVKGNEDPILKPQTTPVPPQLPQMSSSDDIEMANNKATINLPPNSDILETPPAPKSASNDLNQEASNKVDQRSAPNNSNRMGVGAGLTETAKSQKALEKDTKYVAGKKFLLKDGVWLDELYLKADSGAKRVVLTYGSSDYQQIQATIPALQPYFAVGHAVIVVYQGTIYIIK